MRYFFEDGDVSGHFWLETDDDLIDFSCGDWQSEWDLFVGPPINWTALPPEFWWRPRAELGTPASLHPWWSRSQATAPPLGSAWYREACDGEEVLQESATLGAAARLARQHTAQLIESGGRIRRTVVLPHAEDRA